MLVAICIPHSTLFPSPSQPFFSPPLLTPSTPLFCHPSPQFISHPLSSLTYLPPTPFRTHTLIFISSSAPSDFPPTPTLLTLSLHFQYISLQSLLQTIRRSTRWEV